jgi:hypothetical protein
MKADQLRSNLLARIKQRTQPHVEQFRQEITALKQVKKTLKEEGLMEAYSVIAQGRGLAVDPHENDSESEAEEKAAQSEKKDSQGEMIELSDDDEDFGESSEDSEHQIEEDLENERFKPPICGGKVKSIVRVRGNNARLSLKTQLQQKTLLQSSEMVAKRFGLSTSNELMTVLGGMELERFCHFPT